ncbi:hypothetical protein NE237_025807 [Protea cynaroides]|uniref:Retrotransposon gag domain-containing protein n=1 Tax=Protea cynaroides TaxID=273540 RepID=A0A9Q0K0J4_9MAGN|nr:hypothetical protein NE237_025807 [Protea cynaroides]
MEMTLGTLPCTDTQKVKCTAYQLEGSPYLWWMDAERRLREQYGKITWEVFRDAFLTNYIPKYRTPKVEHPEVIEVESFEDSTGASKPREHQFPFVIKDFPLNRCKYPHYFQVGIHSEDCSSTYYENFYKAMIAKVERAPGVVTSILYFVITIISILLHACVCVNIWTIHIRHS